MGEPARRRLSYREYLDAEALAGVKHEYVDGAIYAMAGGSPAHAMIAANIVGALLREPNRGPCRPYSSDLRVRVDTANRGYYPDVTVICGPVDTAADDRHGATNPAAIFEVLSPTTEAEDRGEKFASYRTLDTLRDYVLVSTHAPRIEHFRRGENGEWILRTAGPGDHVALATGQMLAVDEVFDGVVLDERPPRGG